MDETTDVNGRYIFPMLLQENRILNQPNHFLLCCEEQGKCNRKTIAQLFNDAMDILWPNGIKNDNVLLFLTDVTPYMCKAVSVMNKFYQKMIH